MIWLRCLHNSTGKERDSETGLDYFGARYYAGNMGRFLSVDEGPLREHDPQSLNRYAYVRNNPVRYIDEDGDYWVEANSRATEFRVYRETSWVGAEATSKSWGKPFDYASRRQRGDTNQPGLIPFSGFTFEHDTQVAGLDDPMKYSLRSGIQLDQKVFSAFSKEFNITEQEDANGSTAHLTLTRQQIQQFHDFHTAFRYSQEITKLEGKLEKETDPAKREKLQMQIDQRKSTKEYKAYHEKVKKYVDKQPK